MQGKKTANLEKNQSDKKIKSIKVLHSNSHADRPKISMEGKWLEQLGFHIGDRLQVKYGDRFIFISHAMDGEQPLAVHEPADAYLAGNENSRNMGQACDSQKQEEGKSKQIKVTSSMHVKFILRKPAVEMGRECRADKTEVLEWRNIMLDFDKEGMKELHILSEGMNYPAAIPIYTDWQGTQFRYLLDSIRTVGFGSYDICKWCITHKFKYRVAYPFSWKTIFRNPYKYLKYLEMMLKLKKFSMQA